jgi:hypothetical protein
LTGNETNYASGAFKIFMTKKNCLLILTVLVLAGVYAFYFTDWFTPKIIHITSINERATATRRNARADNPGFLARLTKLANSQAGDSTAAAVIFKMTSPYKLTELKVVDLDEWQTNKNCLPLWHLIPDTNSVPINGKFRYGGYIPGMKSVVPGEHAQPLQPGVKYRLFITDGSAKGEHDFQPIAKPAAAKA